MVRMVRRLALLGVLLGTGGMAAEKSWFERRATGGHRLEVLATGAELKAARLRLIAGARRSIFVSAYAFRQDEEALQILDLLCAKARRKVDVRLLLDFHGSRRFRGREEKARACGIRVLYYNPRSWGWHRLPYVIHEKLAIADGRRVLLGGNGWARHYHRAARDGASWHDLELSVEGPAACRFHRIFAESWRVYARRDEKARFGGWLGGSILTAEESEALYGLESLRGCEPREAGGARVLPLYSNPMISSERPLRQAYAAAIGATSGPIRLYSPYFIPEDALTARLLEARARGVDVTILTNSPKSSDEGRALLGTYLTALRLIDAGVKIRLWGRPSTMHRKGGAFGLDWAFFGSDNLDRRGQDYSSESIVFTDDAETVGRMVAEFELDLEGSVPLDRAFIRRALDATPELRKLAAALILPYL
jgi:cardiolipin synthase